MEQTNEELNFDGIDFSAELDMAFEECEEEIKNLERAKENIGSSETIVKSIENEVMKQLEQQLGFKLTEETLVEAYDRKHPGETYETAGEKAMQDSDYRAANSRMRAEHEAGNLADAYSGRKISPGEGADLDHTVPRREIYEDVRRKQADRSVSELSNMPENLNPTTPAVNRSKGAKSAEQFAEYVGLSREIRKQKTREKIAEIKASGRGEAEKRREIKELLKKRKDLEAIDSEKLMEADKRARKAIGTEINKGVLKETAKQTGKDAVKAMAAAALLELLRQIIQGLVKFFSSSGKSFKSFIEEIKNRIGDYIQKIGSMAKNGASVAVGDIVMTLFEPVVRIFKGLASLLKQGALSIIEAIRYLSAPENKNKTFSVRAAEISKIFVGMMTGAAAIMSGEFFSETLEKIPGFQTQIPLIGSIASVTGVFLGSLVSGIVGAIILNFIDRFISERLKNENIKNVLQKKGELLTIQTAQMECAFSGAGEKKAEFIHQGSEMRKEIEEQLKRIETIRNQADRQKEATGEYEAEFANIMKKLRSINIRSINM